MIKIIKEGKTDFRLTCDKCGCIFEYNVADIDDCYIKCPTCGKQHYAFEADYELEKDTAEFSITELTKPDQSSGYYTVPLRTTPGMPVDPLISQPIGTLRVYSDECENCDFTKALRTKGYYIGDTPCQWCSKNPYRVTCNGTSTASYRDKSVRVSYTTGATTGGTSED